MTGDAVFISKAVLMVCGVDSVDVLPMLVGDEMHKVSLVESAKPFASLHRSPGCRDLAESVCRDLTERDAARSVSGQSKADDIDSFSEKHTQTHRLSHQHVRTCGEGDATCREGTPRQRTVVMAWC